MLSRVNISKFYFDHLNSKILTVVVADDKESRDCVFGKIVPVSCAVVEGVEHVLLGDEPVVGGDCHCDDDQ